LIILKSKIVNSDYLILDYAITVEPVTQDHNWEDYLAMQTAVSLTKKLNKAIYIFNVINSASLGYPSLSGCSGFCCPTVWPCSTDC